MVGITLTLVGWGEDMLLAMDDMRAERGVEVAEGSNEQDLHIAGEEIGERELRSDWMMGQAVRGS